MEVNSRRSRTMPPSSSSYSYLLRDPAGISTNTTPSLTSGRLRTMHDHGHDHGVSAETRIQPLAIALGLIVAFMAAEVALAIVADSLALLSDAAHMLVDAAALGLSVWAARLALRPPQGGMTFGLRRA